MLVDTHVHLHPRFDRHAVLDHTAANLAAARADLDSGEAEAGGPDVEGSDLASVGILMLTESHGVDQFRRLREGIGRDPTGSDGWRVEPTEEESSVVARRGERRLYIIAGRQVAARERLEVLVLGTRRRYADGGSFLETLERVGEDPEGVPVVPWGFGKWWGSRGRLLATALERRAGRLLLGDSGGRPRGAPEPGLMRRADELGVPVVAGSDPLPLPGEERRPGSYGSVVRASFDPARPAASVGAALRGLSARPSTFGRRVGLGAFLRAQVLYRTREGRP